MIKTWKHRGIQELFETGKTRRIDQEMVKRTREILSVIDAAKSIKDIDQPGYRLHTLRPYRPDTWTVRVRAQWRITFEFRNGDAYDLDFEDYH